jgi:molybdopterin converting factor subunit 1
MEVLLFGIVREIVGEGRLSIPADAGIANVADLREWLTTEYPQFGGLSSLAIAVNSEYAHDDMALTEAAEIALIPPVSGG